MLDFFINLMIVTGGVISILLWLAIALALLVELFDWLNKDRGPGVVELGDNDYGYEDRSK